MMSCKNIVDRTSELLEEEQPFLTRLELKFHLFICSRCRRFMRQMRLTIGVTSMVRPMTDISRAATSHTQINQTEINEAEISEAEIEEQLRKLKP